MEMHNIHIFLYYCNFSFQSFSLLSIVKKNSLKIFKPLYKLLTCLNINQNRLLIINNIRYYKRFSEISRSNWKTEAFLSVAGRLLQRIHLKIINNVTAFNKNATSILLYITFIKDCI